MVVIAALPASAATGVKLENERVALVLGEAEKGAIVSLKDRSTGLELVASQASPRLFALSFSKRAEPAGERFTLTSRDARQYSASVISNRATLNYTGFGEWPVEVVCTASVKPGDPLVRWRIAVKVPGALMLEAVQFPLVVLRAPMGDSVADDAAVLGAAKGGVIRQPGSLKPGTRFSARQPGSLAAQFGCYYENRVGFFTAAQDGQGWPKEIELQRTREGLEMNWRLSCYEAASFAPNYDLVLTTFHGADAATPTDWRDAADLYKTWAQTQVWCAKTFDQRTDVPTWLKEGPAMVRFSRNWLARPEQVERWLTDYWKKHFPDAPLITAYWGWEKIGSWVTPDYFPVYPSDEQFTKLVARARTLGAHAFPWPSGYHWTLTYRKQTDGRFEWDDRQHFDQVARAHAIHGRDGKLYVRTPSWLAGGDTACLCPGDPWTLRWWNQDICVPLARRGSELIQVDQVVGGGFPVCYDRFHGHPPGAGPWVTAVFLEQLRSMYTACRAIQPDAVVCVEEPNEQFIHLVGLQDYRDCETPHEWASVFSYLYHEYLPPFQSNPHAGDQVMAAYCLANGQIPHLSPSTRVGTGTALVNGGFEEALTAPETMAGWDKVNGYQGKAWKGNAWRDTVEKHGGQASLCVENTADADVVQVSQNVNVEEGGFTTGRKYRLSAWMKTGSLARSGGINFGVFAPGTRSLGVGGRLPFPSVGAGWMRGTAEFTVPSGASFLRIMIHVDGPAKAWVDDVTLEEIKPDGTTVTVLYSSTPPQYEFMRRWVTLYHGEGRPYLQFGRMLHPPKLSSAVMDHKGKPMAAVLHNAYRAPDGSEAVVLANATPEPQPITMRWKGREVKLSLTPGEVRLVR